MTTTVIENAYVVTGGPRGVEHAGGHVVCAGNRITAVGGGPAPEVTGPVRRLNAAGCLVTAGFVNVHHHLYQWLTRGFAVDGTLFEWLTSLYPVWAGLDEDLTRVGATGALGWLARTGCSTTTDHHYVFPAGGGDLLGATVAAAARVGLRFHPTRGSMDLGRSRGGLPPDEVVEDRDTVLAASAAAIAAHHDPAPDAMVRVALAPCSPFSVTAELLAEAAELARRHGVRLHTHLCETLDEVAYCRERFGATPVEYLGGLGWLGPDVWYAHAIHLDDPAIAAMAASGTGVAHCPSSNARLGAGIARVRDLLDAGVPVGLGVDGAASNESCSLWEELRHAVLFARLRGGPRALAVREALDLATTGGARLLGREAEIGTLEVGKLADLAVWRLDTLPHADVADPVAALVLGSRPPLELLLVNGVPVVEQDRLARLEEGELARDVRDAGRRLRARVCG